jgi:S-adenosylmethionine/arginine decarboxylase-like enzyme
MVDKLHPHSHSQLSAELKGIAPEQLRNAAMLSGLLVSAASAAGCAPMGLPVVRDLPNGISAVLLMESAHIVIHTIPDRQTLLFDALAPASHDFRKALEVFSRRLIARDVKTDTRVRG